jgi:predicted amidohydrolase
MNGETLVWLKQLAKEKQVAITGSLIIKESENYYNRLVFVHPNGIVDVYDKHHAFTLAGEHEVYTEGKNKRIVNYKGWKICPLICYDLRFPVWARNIENYDVLLYVANWPKPRIKAWDILLNARAIENMTYCIGVNRVGVDPNGHEYTGHSVAYDTLGEKLTNIEPSLEQIEMVTLSKSHIEKTRTHFNFLNDKDDFNLKV